MICPDPQGVKSRLHRTSPPFELTRLPAPFFIYPQGWVAKQAHNPIDKSKKTGASEGTPARLASILKYQPGIKYEENQEDRDHGGDQQLQGSTPHGPHGATSVAMMIITPTNRLVPTPTRSE